MENKGIKRRRGDRRDGWRVRSLDPIFTIMPHLMRGRNASQVLYKDRVALEPIEKLVRQYREQIPGLSIMHVIVAAFVRLYSQRPLLNRFVVDRKVYARNHISICLTVKKEMRDLAEETVIKMIFSPEDTIADVVRKVEREYRTAVSEQAGEMDKTARLLSLVPSFMLRWISSLFLRMDDKGVFPASLLKVSPWHCSLFLSNLGSLGSEAAYHHLYEFGTCGCFATLGRKSFDYVPDGQGNLVRQKGVWLKYTIDERMCDGFYLVSSLRLLGQLLSNPSVLLTPPAAVVDDPGVRRS